MVIQSAQQIDRFNRAIIRAQDEKVQVFAIRKGVWGATSVSRPGLIHTVINDTCDCEAGTRGIMCKHVAAVVKARAFAGEIQQCDHCGRIAEDVQVYYYHVGGHVDSQPRYECEDRTACWQRWDEQNGFVPAAAEPARKVA